MSRVPRSPACGKSNAVNDAVDIDGIEGKVSYAEVRDAWYVICTSEELGKSKPLSRKLHQQPLVVFRGPGGKPGVLLDRCAHRNVPLSLGRVVDCQVECPYHGWRYDTEGDCRKIPGLLGKTELPRRAVPQYPTREQDGYVWIWGNPESEPVGEPYRPPKLDDPRYHTARKVVTAKGTLHAVAENALDVPHTAFLHKGLFRGTGTTNEIKAVVTRDASSVQCEYIGEPRPEGLVGRVLSPSGGVVTHFDRFLLPSIAQVEYAIGEENHILITSLCTPEEPFFTRLYALVTWRMRFPAPVVKAVLDPVASSIFAQDAKMLDIQTKHVTHFGGERYTSTEIDLLGPQIWRLLKRAAEGRGAKPDDEDYRREIRFEA